MIRHRKFYLLKKDDSLRSTGEVNILSRHYAKTYEECIEVYNNLIKEKHKKLRTTADELEKEILDKEYLREKYR